MTNSSGTTERGSAAPVPLMAFAWLWVGAPFAYGLFELVRKLQLLFTG